MAKNVEIREKVLKVLRRYKRPLSRAEIAEKLSVEPAELPVQAMRREGLIVMVGESKHDAKYVACACEKPHTPRKGAKS